MAVCYRHPNRETNVACSNCGRPICPDCMTSTPVGMRCPECSRQRTHVRALTPGLSSTGTPATFVLIALNVAAFVAEIAAGGSAASFQGGGKLIHDYGLAGPQVADGEVYRIVTSAFLHAGPLHILLNMFALYILGNLLERGIGTARFLGVYFVSMLTGALGALLLDPHTITVGASGAIFGLMSAAFVVARHRGIEGLASQIGFYVILNLAFTFSVPNISVGGHLGGLVGGAIAALVITRGERLARPGVEALGLLLLAAVTVAGSLVVANAA
jgi:membrane associated rhomboid family serine protease